MSAMFIMLEGGEGAGKTTLAGNLERALQKKGHEVLRTREPGGTPWGEKIRNLLIAKHEDIDHSLTPMSQLMGYYMARFENLERVILPALRAGKTVISDRFELSSYAYQVHAQGDAQLEALFLDLHRHVSELLRPFECVYILCDVHPDLGLARVKERGETESAFDAEHIEFHHKVREGMMRAQGHLDPAFRCVVIDASRSREEVLADALKAFHE